MKPTFGSICAGIGGFDLGFEEAGFECSWQVEINAACRKVLKNHFPKAKIYDDITCWEVQNHLSEVNVLVGGTPCQGFSIAGMRLGIGDNRSNLCFQFCKIADRLQPDVIVWENVPGVLSLQDNAFGCFLGALVGHSSPLVHPLSETFREWNRAVSQGIPYPVWPSAGLVAGPKRKAAWRVLDSQYFGVAQRRERLFVVADSGDGSCLQILFEPEMLRRYSPPSREEGEGVAGTLKAGATRSGGSDLDYSTFIPEVCGTLSDGAHRGGGMNGQDAWNGRVIAVREVANAIQEREGKGADSLCTQNFVVHIQQDPIVSKDAAPCLGPGGSKSGQSSLAVAFHPRSLIRERGTNPTVDHTQPLMSESDGDRQCVAFQPRIARNGRGQPEVEICPTLNVANAGVTSDSRPCVAFTQRTRPDGRAVESQEEVAYALTNPGAGGRTQENNIATGDLTVRRLTPTECERLQGFPDGWTGKQKDAPRYKQLGNAITVAVSKWIAHRIIKTSNKWKSP